MGLNWLMIVSKVEICMGGVETPGSTVDEIELSWNLIFRFVFVSSEQCGAAGQELKEQEVHASISKHDGWKAGIVECVVEAISRQRHGKHMFAATDTHATIEELLGAVFL
jgi:hypothetical protein